MEHYKISVNDMHILEAVGTEEPRSMSSVAKSLSVTVGTLTIAMNNLVKKGYVNRARSEEDRRVVLISLSEKGEKAYYNHQKFHDDMIQAIMTDLDETQMDALSQALINLRACFLKY